MRHVGESLDVIDNGGLPVQALDRRERRAEPRKPSVSLERIKEGAFLSTDVGAGSAVDDDLNVIAGTEDVLAEISARVGLRERGIQNLLDVQKLAAHVNEGEAASDGVSREGDAFQKLMGIPLHQLAVLECSRLTFVGIDDQVRRQDTLRNEAPLAACGKAGPAASP